MKKPNLQEDTPFYKRNLPHLQPKDAVFFITIRLDGSLPKERIKELRATKDAEEQLIKKSGLSEIEIAEKLQKNFNLYFGKFDRLLAEDTQGPHWLKEAAIAKIWTDALSHFDGERYKLICSTIMSNHVHFIFYKLDRSLEKMMHSLKSFTGTAANKVLNRIGEKFWQAESFDRMIRNRAELKYRINYVLNNPVEAGLVKHWKEYKHNYIHPDFLKYVD